MKRRNSFNAKQPCVTILVQEPEEIHRILWAHLDKVPSNNFSKIQACQKTLIKNRHNQRFLYRMDQTNPIR